MAKPKLGSGKRFAALEKKFEGEGKGKKVADAEAASIGIEKYGAKKMGQMAAAGRKRKQ